MLKALLTEAGTSSRLRDRLFSAGRVAVTLAVLAGLLFTLGPREIADVVVDAGPWLLAAAALLMVPVQLLVVAKWYWLTRGRGIDAPILLLARTYFLGNLVSTILPTSIGGDVYRVYRVSRETGATIADVTMTVLFERGTGYGALAWLGLLGAAFHFSGVRAGVAVLVVSALGAAGVLFAVSRVWLPQLPANHLLRRLIKDQAELRLIFSMFVFSLLIQAMFVSSIALIGRAFGVDAPWWYWSLSVAIVALVTIVPVSLGGLGLRESGFAALLASQGASGAAGVSVGFTLALLVTAISVVAVAALEVAARWEGSSSKSSTQTAP